MDINQITCGISSVQAFIKDINDGLQIFITDSYGAELTDSERSVLIKVPSAILVLYPNANK